MPTALYRRFYLCVVLFAESEAYIWNTVYPFSNYKLKQYCCRYHVNTVGSSYNCARWPSLTYSPKSNPNFHFSFFCSGTIFTPTTH